MYHCLALTSCCESQYCAVLSSCYTLIRCSPFTSATAVEECKQRNNPRFCRCAGFCGPQWIQGLQLAAPTCDPDREGRIATGGEGSIHAVAILQCGPGAALPVYQTKEHYLRTMLWYGTMNVLPVTFHTALESE